jgi:4a-hydroxytetrahydrobiopterin dehydratase
MQKLTDQQIEEALIQLPGWNLTGGELTRTFSFQDFTGSMVFVGQVAELAESKGHHPDIDIRYNRVKLALVTHDAGGITKNDTEMAANINKLE